jgi:hypothetical protein
MYAHGMQEVCKKFTHDETAFGPVQTVQRNEALCPNCIGPAACVGTFAISPKHRNFAHATLAVMTVWMANPSAADTASAETDTGGCMLLRPFLELNEVLSAEGICPNITMR